MIEELRPRGRQFATYKNFPVLHVLYEDNHLLVVAKPAGLATQGAAEGEESLITHAKEYLKQKYQKPGNVFVGVVSRLDSAVSGVIVLARTSKAAERLTEQFRARSVQKKYWAVVADRPKPASGELRDWLVKDERLKKVVVTRRGMTDAKEAVLTYETKGAVPGGTWLEIELQTGRKHQIRVQLAQRGWHILGDQKYGSKAGFPHGIALHARTLIFEHPVKHEPLEFTATLPKSWRAFQIEKFEKPAT